jgi:UDP-N-acetylmuramoyl-L-alanyl-D-glutamate--2,6-diaminopimelate ligase
MESYLQAKARFFREFLPAAGTRAGMAFNGDDAHGARLAREFPGALTFGFSRERTVHPLEVEMSWEGTRLALSTPAGPIDLRARILGAFNTSNIMAAVCGAILLGVPPGAIREGVEGLPAVPGRMEEIPNGRGIHVFVDYAHSPDGLDRLLSTLRELGGARLITVFGCGGNRDRAKRPEMGRIAARRSDVVILTSDNPRNEDPGAILSEIVRGVAAEGLLEAKGPVPWEAGYYEVIPDRTSAIARALATALPGDTVAVAGKGHENVQLIGDRSLPFDDRETVRAILADGG